MTKEAMTERKQVVRESLFKRHENLTVLSSLSALSLLSFFCN